jgi:outer membrane murein-binding lipoprotein Lpp
MFKAHWDTEGDSVRLSLPFSKVDIQRRIVSGFATLDNIDKQNDIVTTEASVKAFSKFRGNIREMHQPSAVGKMVSFKEDKYFDPESKKFYSGVYVSAYISKGAENTWEKVVDGTYTGFSIGGRMNKWDDAYDEKMDVQIRVIKDYDLVELSLVDNPANQFASILAIEKVDGVDTFKGEATEVAVENVFWDESSGIVMLSEEDAAASPSTGEPMKNIGFVEKSDEEKKDMIKFLVDSAKGINTSKITKEVNPMTDETTELVENAEEAVIEETVEKSEEVAPEADATESDIEKSENMDEEKSMKDKKMEDEEEDAEKAEKTKSEDEMKSEDEVAKSEESEEVSKSDDTVAPEAVVEIKNTLTSAFSDLAETLKALHTEVNALKKSITGVSEEVAAAKQQISEAKGQFDEFGKRVDAVEQDTAFRKSGDLGEIVQEQPELVEKSLWGGRFLKTADLFN